MDKLENLKLYLPYVLIFTITCFIFKYEVWHGFNQISSLSFFDYDYILFSELFKNIENFKNSLLINFLIKMKENFFFLSNVSEILTNIGVLKSHQILLFYILQLIFGFTGLYLIITSLTESKLLLILITIFFLFSFFSIFGRFISGPAFYGKVTSGIMAISLGYICLGLFLKNFIKTSLVLSAILFYIHPTYSAVFLLIIYSYLLYIFFLGKFKFKEILLNFIITLFLLSPFLYSFLVSQNFQSILINNENLDLWFMHGKAKTTNAFPLQDGFVVVLTSIFLYVVTFSIYKKFDHSRISNQIKKCRWIIGTLTILWLTQIIFTEIIPIQLIAKLALTRVTPYLLLFMVIIFIFTIFELKEKDDKGVWLFILLIPAIITDHLLPAQSIRYFSKTLLNNIDVIHLILLTLLVISPFLYISIRLTKLKKYLSLLSIFIITTIGIILLYIFYKFNGLPINFIIQLPMKIFGSFWPDFSRYPDMFLIFIFLIMYGLKIDYFESSIINLHEIKKFIYYQFLVILFFVILVAILNYEKIYFDLRNFRFNFSTFNQFIFYLFFSVWFFDYKLNESRIFKKLSIIFTNEKILFAFLSLLIFYKPSYNLINKIETGIIEENSAEKNDIEKIKNYLIKNTKKNDMILILPFWDTRIIQMMPLRPVFVNWIDSAYVLYDHTYIKELINRYKLIGFEIDKAMNPKTCQNILQYLIPMCKKIKFEDLSKQYSDEWRFNLKKIKEIAPNLKYIILRNKNLNNDDKIIFSVSDLNIIELK